MKRIALFVILFFALTATLPQSPAVADILFESGTLGPTGISWQDALDGLVGGSSVSNTVFSGVRFELTQRVAITEISGHVFSPAGGDFFGAIVALDDSDDFPNSGNLSTPDVLGHTLLEFPIASAEAFGNLSFPLDPGWYALVLGSGLFGATGNGGMILNNPDIGNPSYIAFQPLSGVPWIEISQVFKDFRFVVYGNIIPEPSSVMLALIAFLLSFIHRI